MGAATLVNDTFSRWSNHEGQRLGAALAFYALLSGAPLLLFILLMLSAFFSQEAIGQKIVAFAQDMMGHTGGTVAHGILQNAQKAHHGTLAAVIAFITLLFSASGAFVELRADLNKMWDARPKKNGIVGMILQRAFAFLLVIAAGVLLFASMLATTTLSLVARYFGGAAPVPSWALGIANFIVSFAVLTSVFVLVFRFVPECRLPWKNLWTGAAVSALLFVIGKAVLGVYLSKAGVGSAYGAAGSLIAIAFWIYYSAQIFLMGAEFTYVWSRRQGARDREPEPAGRN